MILFVGLGLVGMAGARADALDEVYYRTFFLGTIGNWMESGTNSVQDYRARLLAFNGGRMPANLKVGISFPSWFMRATLDDAYDFIYSPYEAGHGMEYFINLAREAQVPLGMHFNGMPWGDSTNQSLPQLQNYLEEYGGGEFLQVDRLGRIRMASLPQDPTLNEQATNGAPCLEMQLTLSRNATMVQDYVSRNARIAARALGWYREEFPDVVKFASMSSEYGQNVAANNEFCDYSQWSRQEFRDWLSGAGFYTNAGQNESLADLNNAFAGAPGFPHTIGVSVQPPTTVNWNGAVPVGAWWCKWQQFRVAQVHNMEQAQMDWTREAGWSPDFIYGHQIPLSPASTVDRELKYASPWTTAFVLGGSDGITTYGSTAASAATFAAVDGDNANWGILEFNPMSAVVSINRTALETVWAGRAHVLCPYRWFEEPTYQIRGSALETALQQFVAAHATNAFSGPAPFETAPAARDVIWPMNGSIDVRQLQSIGVPIFTNGCLTALAQGSNAAVVLALDDNRHLLNADRFFAVSFRLGITNGQTGTGRVSWLDASNQAGGATFTVGPGTNVYRVDLAANPAWRGRQIRQMTFMPGNAPGTTFMLDWIRLEAGPSWHFTDAREVYGTNQFSQVSVGNGSFRGVCGADGYLYLATDDHSVTGHARRAWVDADFFKTLRLNMTVSAGGVGQFYWWKRSGGPYCQNFAVSANTNRVEVDLSTNADWCGQITRLRITPVRTSGATVALNCVSFAPALLPPRPGGFELIANSEQPVFTWNASVEPEHAAINFDFQLARDFGFTNMLCATNGLADSQFTLPSEPVIDGMCWWRVRSRAGDGAISPWALPMPSYVHAWRFASTNDIAATLGMSTAVLTNGSWQATVRETNASLDFNLGGTEYRGINADLYPRLHLRAKVAANVAGNWAGLAFTPLGATNAIQVPIQLPADGQWHDVWVNFSGYPDWKGYIQRLQLLPSNQVGATVALSRASLVPFTVPMPQVAPSAATLRKQLPVAGLGQNALLAMVAPQITVQSAGPDGVNLELEGVAGRAFQVEASTNLLDWYLVLDTNAAAPTLRWTDSHAPVGPRRFYRLRVR